MAVESRRSRVEGGAGVGVEVEHVAALVDLELRPVRAGGQVVEQVAADAVGRDEIAAAMSDQQPEARMDRQQAAQVAGGAGAAAAAPAPLPLSAARAVQQPVVSSDKRSEGKA